MLTPIIVPTETRRWSDSGALGGAEVDVDAPAFPLVAVVAVDEALKRPRDTDKHGLAQKHGCTYVL